jgi:hypothetical protein
MLKVRAIDPSRPNVCSHRPVGGFGTAHRAVAVTSLFLITSAVIFSLTNCTTFSRHQFVEPAKDWQTRSGQLLYRTSKTTVIGEVLVRFSKQGDFELTFFKGPGVTLLALRQNPGFAEVTGPLAGRGWSGSIENAPLQLRGWLQLRDKLVRAKDQQSLRYSSGTETFQFRF